MLNYYQPFLLPFLRSKRYTIPQGIARKYFISFEDALWNILPSLGIKKGAVILVPDFYCMDVVQNIRNHGFSVVFYPVDKYFQIQKELLYTLIHRHKPAVVVFFHACGIPNACMRDRQFIKKLAARHLIIEDAVHLLLNPKKIHIYHDNHIIIDSLRKVLPLQGSFTYGSLSTVSRIRPAVHQEWDYVIVSSVYLALFRLMLITGTLLRLPSLVRFAHFSVLKKHDDLIGDSVEGHEGPPVIPLIHRFIAFNTIEKVKTTQCKYYSSILGKIFTGKSFFYRITDNATDYGRLHVYPVGYTILDSGTRERLDAFLQKYHIPVWSKFPDCPWSKTHGVLFLPLGFHVRYNEIEEICSLLTAYSRYYDTENTKQKRTENSFHKRGVRKNTR